MKVFFFSSLMFLFSFPLYSSPISLGAVLVLTSASFVMIMSLSGSWWYSYILFLVYIGGLLVLFIYVCLISSNYYFYSASESIMIFMFSSILTYLISVKPYSKMILGSSLMDMGSDLVNNWFLWLFGGLVVLLLVLLLVVVRSTGAGAISMS